MLFCLLRFECGARSASAVLVSLAEPDAEEVCVAGVRERDHTRGRELHTRPHEGDTAPVSV